MTTTLAAPPTRSPWQRLRSLRQSSQARHVDLRDAVTGLLHRDPFLEASRPLVACAHTEMRELAVVSILVDDIDVPVSRYTEPERNEVLALFGAQLLKQQSSADIIGRVGLAEFVWVSLIESRNDAWRFLADVRADTDAALAADPATEDASYRFGVTLSRGREVDLMELIGEARERRGASSVSAAS